MNCPPTFLERTLTSLDALARACAPAGGEPGVLVALSGGPDSTALLLAACAWRERGGGPIAAAHLNHGLRGDEAEADQEFCVDLCRRLDVALHLRRADPRILAAARGRGDEEAGRALRRRFLREVLDEEPSLCCCATGHHRDDQVETVLMRLFRGAGVDGLAGIRPRSGRFIHPLLEATRAEILAFLDERGQDYRSDRSNRDGRNVRARLRRELLPLTREIFGAGSDAGPARLAGLAARDADFLEAQAAEALDRLRAPSAAAKPLPLPGLASLPAAPLADLPRPIGARVLRLFLAGDCGLNRDLGRDHLDGLLDWLRDARSGSARDLIRGWRAWRVFDRVAFTPPSFPDGLSGRAKLAILEGPAATAPIDPAAASSAADGAWSLTCPAASLRGRPRLRSCRPGDRYVPLGMTGRKRVVDLLRERRIPAPLRSCAPVVEDDAGIVWIVGLARDDRTRLLPDGGPTVTLSVRLSPAQPCCGMDDDCDDS